MAAPNDVPVYHYFELGRLGRGEVVKLFLKDAGIDIKEVRYPYDETWAENGKRLQQQGLTRTRKLPALEYKGMNFTQHIPTLRFFARELGRYDGETNAEKFLVDAVSDIYIDWRAQWLANLTENSKKYKDEVVPDYYSILGQYYNDHSGPYLLGNTVTYADFAVYQSIDNDERTGTLLSPLPESLLKFREAFEQRPNIAAYLKETRPC